MSEEEIGFKVADRMPKLLSKKTPQDLTEEEIEEDKELAEGGLDEYVSFLEESDSDC